MWTGIFASFYDLNDSNTVQNQRKSAKMKACNSTNASLCGTWLLPVIRGPPFTTLYWTQKDECQSVQWLELILIKPKAVTAFFVLFASQGCL